MMRPKRMVRIRAIGSKNLMRKTINTLHSSGLLHIDDYTEEGFFNTGNPFEDATEHSELIVKIGSLISSIGIRGKPSTLKLPTGAKQKLNQIESQYLTLLNQLSEAKENLSSLENQNLTISPLLALGIKPTLLKGYSSIAVFKGFIQSDFTPALKKVTPNFELSEAEFQGKKVFALFINNTHRERAQEILSKHGYSPLELPDQLPKNLSSSISSAKAKITEIESALERLKNQSAQFLLDYEAALMNENEKAEAPLRLATSETSFAVYGWVPKENLDELANTLNTTLGGKIYLEALPESKNTPVALENPKPVQPFQFLFDLYTLPTYNELDPTFLAFLVFPLFFGFILGDVGYGIVTLIISIIARSKTKGQLRAIFSIGIVAALGTILFGFVFGEFFGYEFLENPLLNRVHDIQGVLIVAILIGAAHITLGLLLGFYNILKHHGLKHAILEKGGWLLLEAGAALIILDYLGMLQITILPGAIVSLISIVLLYMGEGIMGLIELPGLLSNILSYARLFAVGLASVELALIINQFAGDFIAQGGFMIILAILVLVIGHTLNIAIGLLGSFLHPLRLHYIEFFSKFFHGGGIRYAPFGQHNKEV